MKILILLAATISVVLAELIVATTWMFLPVFVADGEFHIYKSQILSYSSWVALVTGTIVLFIGMPIFLVLKKLGKATFKILGFVGFLIPVLILGTIMLFTSTSGSYSAGQNYHGTYRKMVIDGEQTFWGWLSTAEQFVTFGIYGVLGAILFSKIVSLLSN